MSDFRIENTDTTEFRPVLRSQDRRGFSQSGGGSLAKRLEKQELDEKINSAIFETPHQPGEPYTFPTLDFNFNLEEAVQSSLANYTIRKNKYAVKNGGYQFSAISNQS